MFLIRGALLAKGQKERKGLFTFSVKFRSEPLENSEKQDKQDRKRQDKQDDKRYKGLISYIILLILPLAILLILFFAIFFFDFAVQAYFSVNFFEYETSYV